MMKEQLWDAIRSVKQNSPLVHNITNFVVMNNTANALLAAGASPIMAHAHPEVEDMVALCGATVINIGTLSEYWVTSMLKAAAKAHAIAKPWILDPVGAGATAYRDETITKLLAYKPAVIRGNASEIMALAKASQTKTKGVDSVHQSAEAIDAALWLNQTVGSVVCISGATDVVVSGNERILLKNGHPLMTKVTGLGCSATALIGAFVANDAEHPFLATAAAMALLSIAGELAEKQSSGPGSLQVNLLDKLHNITESEFLEYINVEHHSESVPV